MEGVEADSPILKNITLIDTPGILSGQKQRSRNYEYESVMKWFGERADVSFVFFTIVVSFVVTPFVLLCPFRFLIFHFTLISWSS